MGESKQYVNLAKGGGSVHVTGAIFDMDGTLVDSLGAWDILWERMGQKFLNQVGFRYGQDENARTATIQHTRMQNAYAKRCTWRAKNATMAAMTLTRREGLRILLRGAAIGAGVAVVARLAGRPSRHTGAEPGDRCRFAGSCRDCRWLAACSHPRGQSARRVLGEGT